MRFSHGQRRMVFVATVCGSASLALVGCSGASPASGTSAVSTPASSAGNGSKRTGGTTGIAHAQEQLARFSKTTPWKAPGPAFSVSSAKGKTVWYIPSDYSVPIFHTITGSMKTALAHAGVSLIVCDGKGNPSTFNSCMRQAIASKAGVIIPDSIYPQTIASSISAANSANIPVIMGNTQDPSEPLAHGVAAQVAFQYSLSGRLVSDWIIQDSKGKANVLLTNTTDNPNGKSVLDNGYVFELKKYCPGCKYIVKSLTISQWSTDLGSITRSALSADPSIDYVVPEYDGMTAFMGPAVKALGKQNSVKIATFNADLQQMQQMAAGDLVYVDVGSNNAYEGWAYADQSLRLMTKTSPVANENVPVRVFDRQNVHHLSLSAKAANSGAWYGSNDYQKGFLQLWKGHS